MADNALTTLRPQSFAEVMKFAEVLSKSGLVPAGFKGKPDDILVAIQMGAEVGLNPIQSLQNIAVINGRPTLWGDALLALVQASGKLEYIKETDDGQKATCETKRKDDKVPCITTFSNDDAKRAGLAGKQGPWTQYPARMRQMRARGFNLRDKFADVLKGVVSREEAEDYIVPPDDVKVVPDTPPVQSRADEIDNPPPLEEKKVALVPEVEGATQIGQESDDYKQIMLFAKAAGVKMGELCSLAEMKFNVSGPDELTAAQVPHFIKEMQSVAGGGK